MNNKVSSILTEALFVEDRTRFALLQHGAGDRPCNNYSAGAVVFLFLMHIIGTLYWLVLKRAAGGRGHQPAAQ